LDVELEPSSHVFNEWSLLGLIADEIDTRRIGLNSADLLTMVISEIETIQLRITVPGEYVAKAKICAIVILTWIDSIDGTRKNIAVISDWSLH